MAKKKTEKTEDTIVTTPEVVEETVAESLEKQAFRLFLESYKKQNPEKYALKEVELLEKLKTLK